MKPEFPQGSPGHLLKESKNVVYITLWNRKRLK